MSHANTVDSLITHFTDFKENPELIHSLQNYSCEK